MDTFSPKRLRAAAASWLPLLASPCHRRAPTPDAAFTSQIEAAAPRGVSFIAAASLPGKCSRKCPIEQ
ncbi:hypothetical protein U9M48_003792 [Paspalum notatum var. saurae]|uniref:Uncharacterized protein n=1 Tax=Paspalum notatum var. saurae TaxID=547442 RepID=A0AAQ3PNM9_PASNO